ncbi:MAG: hypothetical protein Q9191_002225 [Dirinaria sp. TL-2023a]
MSLLSRALPLSQARGSAARHFTSSARSPYGRTAAYRRILHRPYHQTRSNYPPTSTNPIISLKPRFCPLFDLSSLSSSRPLTSATLRFQQQQPKEEIRDPPREETPAGTAGKDSAENSQDSQSSDSSKAEQEGSEESAGEKSSGEGKKKEPPPPPPPHGDKSPWQVFTETLKSEFNASKEWNESTKALASSAHSFTENESVKRARAAYTSASSATSSATSSAIRGTGKALGQGAAWTWDSGVVKGVRSGVNATGRGIEKVTRPVRETKAYKSAVGGVRDVIDDGSSSRYGGWVEKEERRKQRELREIEEASKTAKAPGAKPAEKVEEDPNAGTNVTLHKDAAWRESWNSFRDSSRLMQSLFTLKSNYHESENPFISTARSITDRVAGFFAENETATVIKAFRAMDPTFQVEPFLREMREYILPEVLDAYVKGDTETLKLWLSAAQYQVYAALTQQYTGVGLKSDGRILDIRHVDILSARMLENEVPVFIITCRTQEVHVYRDRKTGALAAGMEDRVQLVTYAIGVTRVADEVNKRETRGWRLIELQKSARDYI